MSDPLFDPTQKGDDDLAALERVLAEQRYKSPATPWEQQAKKGGARLGKLGAGVLVALAALVIALICVPLLLPKRSDWGLGKTVTTAANQRRELPLKDIGTITLEPETTVTLVAQSDTEQRVQLDRGTIAAKVIAQPRVFMVDTPVTRAVDLGCEYTLHVADNHRTELHVTKGRVSLEDGKNLAVVYAQMKSTQSPRSPPRVPWPDDAGDELEELIRQADVERDATALQKLIDKPCDSKQHCLGPFEQNLVLWHLAMRLDLTGRRAALAKLAEAVPLPAELDPEAYELSRPVMEKYLDQLYLH
ncbi:MAG: FecR family protein [Myxococcaceae bacterium]